MPYQDIRIHSFNLSPAETDDLYIKRYHGESTIRLGFDLDGADSFIVCNTELLALISSIYKLDKKLALLSAKIPSDALQQFVSNSMIEEIQQSNEVENINSTRKEIKDALDAVIQERHGKRFASMVRKYLILQSDKDIPLSTSQDIRNLYNEFIADEIIRDDPGDQPDGEIFRKSPVHVNNSHGETIHEGLFPESKIITAMDSALSILNNNDYDILIRVALFHYFFGYIHPFYNGNGRMSRFISSYMLSTNLEQAICLRLSYVIKEKKNKYLKMYKETEDPGNMGDMTGFVTGFLQLIESACDDAFSDIQEKNNTYQIMKTKLDKYLHDPDRGIAEKYHKIFYYILEKTIFIGDGASYGEIISGTGITKITVAKILSKADPIVYYRKGTREHRWYIKLTDSIYSK